MKYKAVIFDLFGTLVDNFSRREYERVLSEMALVLSAPVDDFIRLWFDIFEERMKGIIQSPKGAIEHICQILNLHPEADKIKLASEIRFEMTKREILPRPDVVEVLSKLKSSGYKTGLISDCTAETPIVWENTPLAPLVDVTVFSCLVGMKKPDPRIYNLAIKRLAVPAEECLYVADGVGKELETASRIGMHPVLILTSAEDTRDPNQINPMEWDGTVIPSLREVLDLVS